MPFRIIPDENQPSAAIEIPLGKPLPDYDLHQLEQPTPRDVDAILVSQGFRDLVNGTGIEITQLTGAICPSDDEVYLPGIWIVLKDAHAAPKAALPASDADRLSSIIAEFLKRLGLS